jgi:hypothetical protein
MIGNRTRWAWLVAAVGLALILSGIAWLFLGQSLRPRLPRDPIAHLRAAHPQLETRSLQFGKVSPSIPEIGQKARSGSGEHGGGKPLASPLSGPPAFAPGEKVAMTDAEFTQVFQAYQQHRWPLFVTSDALLHVQLHVLEETLIRIDGLAAARLRRGLVGARAAVDTLPIAGPADTVTAARRLARIALGVTQRLLVPGADPLADPAEEKLVAAEVELVINARGQYWPEWLEGRPDTAIDATQFQPVGIRWLGDDRVFRAGRWLQAIPWRLDRDEQLLALLLMARATTP